MRNKKPGKLRSMVGGNEFMKSEKGICSASKQVLGTRYIIVGAVTLIFLFPQLVGAQEIKRNPLIGQPEHFGSPGDLRCSMLQLLSPDGEPIKSKVVTLEKEHWKWAKPHISVITIYYRPVRKIKTNGRGEIRLPDLAQEGRYSLTFEFNNKKTFGAFEVGSNWKGEACSETLAIEDRGDYLQLSDKAGSDASQK